MVEFYGRLCCDSNTQKVTFTGPVRGERSGSFASVKPAKGGGSIQHSYPKTDRRVFCPKGTCVVAYYHTHPHSPNFSDADKRYIKLGENGSEGTVAYYMSNGKKLKRIEPLRTDDSRDVRSGGNIQVSGWPVDPLEVELSLEDDVP